MDDWSDDQVAAVKETLAELRGEIDRTFDANPTKASVLEAIDARIEAARATRGSAYAGGGSTEPGTG